MSRGVSTARIRAINEQILDETDRRLRRKIIVGESVMRSWESDPAKCPFYAVGPDLVLLPSERAR